jgi:hypothetical protein
MKHRQFRNEFADVFEFGIYAFAGTVSLRTVFLQGNL